MLAEGSIPRLPVSIEASSDKMSPNKFAVTMVSKCLGLRRSCIAALSIYLRGDCVRKSNAYGFAALKIRVVRLVAGKHGARKSLFAQFFTAHQLDRWETLLSPHSTSQTTRKYACCLRCKCKTHDAIGPSW